LPPRKKAEGGWWDKNSWEYGTGTSARLNICQWVTDVVDRSPVEAGDSSATTLCQSHRIGPSLKPLTGRTTAGRQKHMKNEELLGAVMTALTVVPVSGLLGWSWYCALRRKPPKEAETAMPWWLPAIATLDFAGLLIFRFVLGGQGLLPQSESMQKMMVFGSVLMALAAAGLGWRQIAVGRIPFTVACLLLAVIWTAGAYLLFAPLISGPFL
jgi:hypothetical protein